MHELAEVWTDRKGLVWIAVNAILYALVLIPFNVVQWNIAGISLRPAAALPVVCGILWGPAAAWGLGIGNIAGDLFGSWSLMSIFGFLVNFLYPYLAYLLWHRLMGGHRIQADLSTLSRFWVVTFVTTIVCMFLLAACGTVFFGRPFGSRFTGYFVNGLIWGLIGGSVLFLMAPGPAVEKGWVYGREWGRERPSP